MLSSSAERATADSAEKSVGRARSMGASASCEISSAANAGSFSVDVALSRGAGDLSAAGVACRTCLLARATRCSASFSASGWRGARNRSTMLAAFTCSLVAPKLSTARRMSSLTLMPRLSAVAEMARFWAGVTKTTMRSLGLFIDRLAFFVGVELRWNPGRRRILLGARRSIIRLNRDGRLHADRNRATGKMTVTSTACRTCGRLVHRAFHGFC
ncbi:hypothetical protein PSAB6_470083 [Paraburkholderia sabiae]|nr:hypothetical protein PSAB6_470083 [Paraburkholderia sabiae]